MQLYFRPVYILVIAFLFYSPNITAQCTTTISTFPYVEDFESGAGGWVAGGTLNDWVLGTPTKSVINAAGSGTKCWITGGATASFYNYAERSFVAGPCFDFTNLAHPYIQFKIFWESERVYDGTNLQYSLDAGATWVNVGGFSDAINCLNSNWYNQNSITNLATLANPKEGWAGNKQPTAGSCQGGGGSNNWVTAKHCMAALAGKPSVKFRFTFGSGTSCNDFDGIAFDSIAIGEAPANNGSIAFSCVNANTLNFTGTNAVCADTLQWNFGDPGSGASNTANGLTASHTFLTPGSYNVTLTLRGPCNAPDTITKTIHILGVTVTGQNAACGGASNGIATVSVQGGGGPYTYDWGNGITGQTRTGLAPGNYTVIVSDPQSCSVSATVSIPQATGALQASALTTDVTCHGASTGSVNNITVSGGSTPYTYNWGNGITSPTRTGLAAGNYVVTVTDANGCTATALAAISQPALIVVTPTITNSACTSSTGSISTSTTGGVGAYRYVWSTNATTANISALASGSYYLTVQDANNCVVVDTFTVGQINAPIVTNAVTNATCNGVDDGAVDLTVTGGTQPYGFVWSNAQTTQNITGLAAGSYIVTVTDAQSCSVTLTGVVAAPQAITITFTRSNISCNGLADGYLIAAGSGGTAPFTYLWNNGPTSAKDSNLITGWYMVTVTDANHCSLMAGDSISEPPPLLVNVSATPQSCASVMDGTATAMSTGGTPAYSYLWATTQTTAQITALAQGDVTVTITDANHCTGTANATVGLGSAMQLNFTETQPVCPSSASGTITAVVSGGNPQYSYLWSNGQTDSMAVNLVAGTFIVTVTDSKGCTVDDSLALHYEHELTITAQQSTTIKLGEQTEFTTLTNVDPTSVTFLWLPINGLGCVTCPNTTAGPAQTTVYVVTVEDKSGCKASDSVVVTVDPAYDIFIPNAITPNGDGNNDNFEVFADKKAIQFFSMEVFDRWGEKVFETNDVNFKWDTYYKGQRLPANVYVYLAKIVFLDGYTRNRLTGSLTIIR